MAYPEDLEGWIERVNEIMTEIDSDDVAKAYAGNATAKAVMEAWALEMQAAALFLATYVEAGTTPQEVLVEVANEIIDTAQAILIALAILLLLKKIKKKPKNGTNIQIDITISEAKKIAGDRGKPRPSGRDDLDDAKVKDAAFIKLRVLWTTHFVLTLMEGLRMQKERGGKELVWHAVKDKATCIICTTMDGKKSIDGDFLPVILKSFKDYRVFVPWMPWPHAHPRCRCWATVDGQKDTRAIVKAPDKPKA